MIDHVSVSVRDLSASAQFYERVLAPLGYVRLVERPATVGFGKQYPEFWLNLRAEMPPIPTDTGMHVCLRAPSGRRVRLPHLALHGGSSDGEPGPRQGDLLLRAFVKDATATDRGHYLPQSLRRGLIRAGQTASGMGDRSGSAERGLSTGWASCDQHCRWRTAPRRNGRQRRPFSSVSTSGPAVG